MLKPILVAALLISTVLVMGDGIAPAVPTPGWLTVHNGMTLDPSGKCVGEVQSVYGRLPAQQAFSVMYRTDPTDCSVDVVRLLAAGEPTTANLDRPWIRLAGYGLVYAAGVQSLDLYSRVAWSNVGCPAPAEASVSSPNHIVPYVANGPIPYADPVAFGCRAGFEVNYDAPTDASYPTVQLLAGLIGAGNPEWNGPAHGRNGNGNLYTGIGSGVPPEVPTIEEVQLGSLVSGDIDNYRIE